MTAAIGVEMSLNSASNWNSWWMRATQLADDLDEWATRSEDVVDEMIELGQRRGGRRRADERADLECPIATRRPDRLGGVVPRDVRLQHRMVGRDHVDGHDAPTRDREVVVRLVHAQADHTVAERIGVLLDLVGRRIDLDRG